MDDVVVLPWVPAAHRPLRLRVMVPNNLNAEQKEALRAFAKAMGEETEGESPKGFFDKKKKKK